MARLNYNGWLYQLYINDRSEVYIRSLYTLWKPWVRIDGRVTGIKGESETEYRKAELNKLTQNAKQLQTVIVHCEKHFELKAKTELTAAEQLKLKIFSQTAERIHVSDESGIERVRALKASVDKKAEALTVEFHNVDERYTTYSKIVKTYYEISQGDYISKLVEQERQKQEKEKKENHKKVL